MNSLQMIIIIFCFILVNYSKVSSLKETDPPSEEWKKLIVDAHKELRRGVVPPAGDMNDLVHNETLSQLAYKAASRLDFLHSWGELGKKEYETFGENIFKGGYITPERVVLRWFSERNHYTYNDPWIEKSCETGKVCGHYKQVAVYTITQMGCGYKRSTENNHIYLYCLYDKYSRDPPYSYGKPCSSCRLPGRQFCAGEFCVDNESSSHSEKECKLVCRNCGILNKTSCLCACKRGTSGAVCEEGTLTDKTECPGFCLQRGTPCVNGNDVSTKVKCICNCQSGYVGDLCDYNLQELKTQYVTYRLQGKVYDNNFFPINSHHFRKNLQQDLDKHLINLMNLYCVNTNEFKFCCPNAIVPVTSNISNEIGVEYLAGYPMNNLQGELIVKLRVNVSSEYCQGNGFIPAIALRYFVNATIQQSEVLRKYSYIPTEVSSGEYGIISNSASQPHELYVYRFVVIFVLSIKY